MLREWSAFHERVEQQRTAPATRDHADAFVEYSRDDDFVDSVVDAISLYLAGRHGFDRKLGGHLELMLIQRARAEDVTLLERLAAKYVGDGDLIGVMGLLRRLELYSGDARLHSVIAVCENALHEVKNVADMNAWARSIGIHPAQESWTFTLKIGTAPPSYWFLHKHDLGRRDVSLDLLINDSQWRVQVARVDRNYSAQWRASGITVDTDETRLKAIAVWPTIASPHLFPVFAATLARFLQVEWLRKAWLASSGVEIDRARLLDWLHTLVDELQP